MVLGKEVGDVLAKALKEALYQCIERLTLLNPSFFEVLKSIFGLR